VKMSWCSAVGCSNCTKNCKNTDVSFHFLPKDEKLKKEWEAKIKREVLPKKVYICSEHFTEDCFDVSSKLQFEMMGIKKRRKLLPGSIPTLFKYREEKQRKSMAVKKRQNLEMVSQVRKIIFFL